jgi:ABC-type uncharacterized transport system auxiliary subunit
MPRTVSSITACQLAIRQNTLFKIEQKKTGDRKSARLVEFILLIIKAKAQKLSSWAKACAIIKGYDKQNLFCGANSPVFS